MNKAQLLEFLSAVVPEDAKFTDIEVGMYLTANDIEAACRALRLEYAAQSSHPGYLSNGALTTSIDYAYSSLRFKLNRS